MAITNHDENETSPEKSSGLFFTDFINKRVFQH